MKSRFKIIKHIQLFFLILLSSFIFSSCMNGYFIPKKQMKYAQHFAPYDVIIVPGIPFLNDEWDGIMKTRILWSVYLYKNGFTKNIIYSGSSVYSPYYESEIMKLYAIELGVNPAHIYTEKEAKHGVENLYYSYILAKNLAFKNIALATDPAQNLQIGYYGRPMVNSIELLPTLMDKINFDDSKNIKINTEKAYNTNFKPYNNISALERLLRSSGRFGLKNKMRKYLRNERNSYFH